MDGHRSDCPQIRWEQIDNCTPVSACPAAVARSLTNARQDRLGAIPGTWDSRTIGSSLWLRRDQSNGVHMQYKTLNLGVGQGSGALFHWRGFPKRHCATLFITLGRALTPARYAKLQRKHRVQYDISTSEHLTDD